jgi:hypothetical protein
MATYLFAGLSLFLLLVCGVCFNAVLKAVRMQEQDEKQRHYLEMALKASGLWDGYQRALRHSWELWAQADSEPRRLPRQPSTELGESRIDGHFKRCRLAP